MDLRDLHRICIEMASNLQQHAGKVVQEIMHHEHLEVDACSALQQQIIEYVTSHLNLVLTTNFGSGLNRFL